MHVCQMPRCYVHYVSNRQRCGAAAILVNGSYAVLRGGEHPTRSKLHLVSALEIATAQVPGVGAVLGDAKMYRFRVLLQ